jgi:hypothetical protein
MAFPQSRLQRGYVQEESSFGVIPNSSGTATLAGGDAFLCATLNMNYDQPTAERPDKTGSLGDVLGTPVRITANWDMSCSMAGSGAAATAPDVSPFLKALFGKAPVVNASTSVVYGLDDNNYSLTIYDFNGLATAAQRAIFGAVVNQGVFRFGDTFAMMELSGEGRYVIDTDQFATAAAALKGGLTTFPSEPTPTTAGSSVAGYKGVITLDGNAYTTFRSGDLTISNDRALDKQVWDDDLPGAPAAGHRRVTLNFSMRDDDTANFKALKGKAHSKTPVDLTLQIGKTAGNIWTFAINDVLLGTPQYDTSGRERVVNFPNCRAHMSSLTAKDEVVLTVT